MVQRCQVLVVRWVGGGVLVAYYFDLGSAGRTELNALNACVPFLVPAKKGPGKFMKKKVVKSWAMYARQQMENKKSTIQRPSDELP